MESKTSTHQSFWKVVGRQFSRHPLGIISLLVVGLFILAGIYAPFLASSKPIAVKYDDIWYFPLFRYLFYHGFYTTYLDLFFNVLMFTFPLMLATFLLPRSWKRIALLGMCAIQIATFAFVSLRASTEPSADPTLTRHRLRVLESVEVLEGIDPLLGPLPAPPTWDFELKHMNPYARLEAILRYRQRRDQHDRLTAHSAGFDELALERWLEHELRKAKHASRGRDPDIDDSVLRSELLGNLSSVDKNEITALPTLWQQDRNYESSKVERLRALLRDLHPRYERAKTTIALFQETCVDWLHLIEHHPSAEMPPHCADFSEVSEQTRRNIEGMRETIIEYEETLASIALIHERIQWLDMENGKVTTVIMPLLRPYHWEDDVGGEQALNELLPWWELTRSGRKDLAAALVFGVRVSLVVGVTAIGLALLIGIPIGALAGFYGGRTDIIVSRLMEIWESMPTFFMLLLVVSVTQSKSIFLVICVISFFGWTGFSRFLRGEFFKQRHLPYVQACRSMGFSDSYTIFNHILPNAIPPLLTLLPFAIMGAITAEAGLSFLGLGEEGSCSWGVLMDEGRRAFPGESYLLWPPAALLTILLVAIALVGDALRDALDPRMHS